MKFSTHDQDNDEADDGECAEWWHGTWWYKTCHSAELNGEYPVWMQWEDEVLKETRIMIRPKG
jgi:hypothetical protein